MQGKTHVLYATVSGLAIASAVGAVVPAGNLEIFTPVALVAIPLVARLPDIDHRRSPLGRKLFVIGKICLVVALICAIIVALPTILTFGQTKAITFDFFLVKPFVVLGSLCLLAGLFIVTLKHRGITHDVYFPIGLLFLINFFSVNLTGVLASVYLSLLVGATYGYINHLFMADIFTKRGLTILTPLNVKIVLGFVETGTISEVIFSIVYTLVCLSVVGYNVWRLWL